MKNYYICKGCLDWCFLHGKDIPCPEYCVTYKEDFNHWIPVDKSTYYVEQGLGKIEE